MATNATSPSFLGQHDPSRASRRAQASRLPSKITQTTSPLKSKSSPSLAAAHNHFGLKSIPNGKIGYASSKKAAVGSGAPPIVAPSSLDIPTAIPTSTPIPAAHFEGIHDYLEPSSGTDTPPPPSLVSGSSVSSHDSPRSNVLRRKPSVIAQYVSERHTASKDSTFAQPLIQRIDIPKTRAETSEMDDSAHHTGAGDQTKSTSRQALQEPIELTHGADGHILPRQTPVSEPSTTPSLTYSASPSQNSHTTARSRMSSSPMLAPSPFFGMRPFTPATSKTLPRPNEPLGHPFFRQTNQSGTMSMPSLPGTATSQRPQPSPSKSTQTEELAQTTSTGPTAKPSPVRPPELAHLNSAQSMIDNSEVPPRPSRDGTPNLSHVKKAQPVVQSNLPKLTTSHHHRKISNNSSLDELSSRSPATPHAAKASTTSPQKQKLPSGGSQLSLQSLNESAISDVDDTVANKMSNPPKTKARFGFFSRKPKQENHNAKDASKSSRKGPAAGTGHEGYGKHSMRLRTGSSSTMASSAPTRATLSRRKSSGASSKTSDLDDFLQQRLSPVYLRGEAKDGESQGRTSTSTFNEPPTFTPTTSTPETAHTSTSSADFPKHVLAARGITTVDAAMDKDSGRGRGSTDHVQEPVPSKDSRSSSRKRLVKTRPTPKESSSKGLDVAVSDKQRKIEAPASSLQTADLRTSAAKEFSAASPVKNKRSNWSFFGRQSKESRSHSNRNFSQRAKMTGESDAQQARPGSRDSLSTTAVAQAHYVPPDVAADVTVEDLDNVLREAQAQVDNASDPGTDFEDLDDEIILPVATANKRPSVIGTHNAEHTETIAGRQEQSNLAGDSNVIVEKKQQITTDKPSIPVLTGRTSSVSTRKDHVRKPPNMSFSRPFAQASPKPEVQSPPPSATSALFPPSVHHVPNSSASIEGSNKESFDPTSRKSPSSEADTQSISVNTKLKDVVSAKPFFDHSPRKNSDVSYSSSSGTMYFPTATTIAHGPGRQSHASTDETWPEFDDLIGHMLTPTVSAASHQSKQSKENELHVEKNLPHSSDTCATAPKLGKIETFQRRGDSYGSSPGRVSLSVSPPAESVGVIAATLRDTPSVSTLKSTRSNSVIYNNSTRDSPPASLKHKRSNSLPSNSVVTKAEDKSTKGKPRYSGDQVIHENPFMFRYRVLMTSKWLSFGRLLFSPIHDELGKPDDRVLVIDGLGNRDWSYYCAVSYPQAQVYSLGPSASSGNDQKASFGNLGDLSNYRHFSYTTPGTDFPFPKGFFAAVVYRFPVVGSDAVMRCMISECKRVLRPGGYLEISAIDLDLANMGTICRRAVRNLKMAMKSVTPDVSLRAASDYTQSLIGRRGFENLNRCVVGVPAAGVIASSRENSQDENDVDVTRLANDNTKEGDDHITKMVAQVGRWWYTQCYEMGVLPNGDPRKSLWCDRKLLQECEELNTTFKLLICYAQKPQCAKRRTVSL